MSPIPGIFLVFLAALRAGNPASAVGVEAASDWSVRVTPYDQVFPALEMSQSRRVANAASIAPGATSKRRAESHAVVTAIGEGSGLIAVRLRARHAAERFRLEVSGTGLAHVARVDGVLALSGQAYDLQPPLNWSEELLAAPAAQRGELHFKLWRDDDFSGTHDHAVSLRPLSEALYFVRDGHDTVDLSWIFAAYVNENDPVVDRILEISAQSGIVDKFDGYTRNSDDQVRRQAWAVWQALAAHGIRYSDADPGVARGPREFSQRVLLLEQTWVERNANCIDGSVLIASVLQRIGLRSFLVLVPGHAFVGFYLDNAGTRAEYLETTLLGAVPPQLSVLPGFASELPQQRAREQGIAGFTAALASGRARHAWAAAKLDGHHRPDFSLIDITQARAFGIQPIAAGAPVTAISIEAETNRR